MNKKIISTLLLSIGFFLISTISAKSSLAGGTFGCGPLADGRCVVFNATCDADSVPNYSTCTSQSNGAGPCNQSGIACVVVDPSTCTAAGGSCSDTSECCSGLSCSPTTGTCKATVTASPEDPNSPELKGCSSGGQGIDTAIGCIPVGDEQSLALFLLKWGMGIGGGIALIIIVISTYSIITSAGDPRKMQAGKETLTSAITGLILLVSSAFLLKFIGVDLLGIFSN